MPKLSPTRWQVLRKVFEKDGFKEARTKGSHLVMEKEGVHRPLVIPMYPDVEAPIISGLLRTAGMSRKRYFELLDS